MNFDWGNGLLNLIILSVVSLIGIGVKRLLDRLDSIEKLEKRLSAVEWKVTTLWERSEDLTDSGLFGRRFRPEPKPDD